jgi:hypothetical protein
LKHTSGRQRDQYADPEEHSPTAQYAVAAVALLTTVATAGAWLYAGPLAAMLVGAFVFVAATLVLFFAVIAVGSIGSR